MSAGFDDLHTQLKITNRLLVAGLKKQMQQNEIISLLASTGASNQEIGEVLDTSADVVKTTIQRMKKKKAK